MAATLRSLSPETKPLVHYLRDDDLSIQTIVQILNLSAVLKAKPRNYANVMAGYAIHLQFTEPSLRTQLSIQNAMGRMGGASTFVRGEFGSVRESFRDHVRTLAAMNDAIFVRTEDHSTLEMVAANSKVPVINALTKQFHPLQVLANMMTAQELYLDLKQLRYAFVGDGNNNVVHSLLLTAPRLGVHLRIAAPEQLMPSSELVDQARSLARNSGGSVELFSNPLEAVSGAQIIETDTWVGIGQESEADWRRKVLAPYQVNSTLVQAAASKPTLFHCMPAHHDNGIKTEEITEEMFESDCCAALRVAENRMWTAGAVLTALVKKG